MPFDFMFDGKRRVLADKLQDLIHFLEKFLGILGGNFLFGLRIITNGSFLIWDFLRDLWWLICLLRPPRAN
jgi:hypothetical protein